METSKHTKGPWAIEYRTDGQFTYSPRIYAGPAVIHYSAGYHTEEQDAKFKARAEANARLIAAAPELLEALKVVAAVAIFDVATQNQVDTALAKATGGQA